MKHIKVVAAVIVDGDRIFCVQRPAHKFDYLSFKYEFPGGKVEDGENKIEALKREMREELSIEIDVDRELLENYHEYADFALTMTSFICRTSEKPVLNEHISGCWLKASELDSLDWAEADKPIVARLKEVNL